MARFDVVVIGLGVMGSAALHRLAVRGVRVLGIERYEPGHDRGSSHGATRIIRLGYFEHPSYVSLLRDVYPLWRELEAKIGRRLLHTTGIAEIGAPESELVKGTLTAARQHALPHDVLDAAALMRRYPAFRVPGDFVGVVQPDGGFLEAEPALLGLVKLARAGGAAIRTNEAVRAIEPHPGGVRVVTSDEVVEASAVIVTAGARVKSLIPDLPAPLRVTRQVLAWFEPRDAAMFSSDRFPVFMIESPHGLHYGFPMDPHRGVKLGRHRHLDETVDPDNYDRTVSPRDERAIRVALENYIPAADGKLVAATTCLYTMAPDGDFIIDTLPGWPQVVIGSPCSGHGFKFAPLIGEILADLAMSGQTKRDIARFRLARFQT
ncbi:MAG TPA: N-methyl-L-tryptophan oxidase [Xanthobacteraceae bacterium]|nr:N-methyl-L-tryptophan oxidase [Xanthobacteraceae bacterium]